MDDAAYAQALQKLLAQETLPHYRHCHIFYNFKEVLAVPQQLYLAAEAGAMLSDVYGANASDRQLTTELTEATLIYRVPNAVFEALGNRFYGATTSHTNACLFNLKKEGLYCVVYSSYIKCVLTTNGTVQLLQSYPYQSPADVAYLLLNICTQHGLSPAEIELTMGGFIDRQSHLYEEVYKYFMKIQLDTIPENASLAADIEANCPPHFFSYLIHLIQCAS